MQHNNLVLENEGESMSQVSMINGYWFYFKHAGNEVSVHGSAWSGKEAIYVNNHPVSIKRVLFSRKSSHEFNVGDIRYRMDFNVESLLKGRVVATLYANDELVDKESLAYAPNKKSLLAQMVVGFLAGFGLSAIVISLIESYL